MAPRIIRNAYWRGVGIIARVTRSVQAVNLGFSPGENAATGPRQPMIALRDSVALLGATAGRLDARLEFVVAAASTPVQRVAHALVLSELSRLAPGTTVRIAGDETARRLAADAADLALIVRAKSDSEQVADTDVVCVVSGVPLGALSPEDRDHVEALLASPATRTIRCQVLRPDESSGSAEVRTVPSSSFEPASALQRVALDVRL